jgi:drug/metabolite transporter (DMT)-like permease
MAKLYGALISLSLIWGLSFVFIKILLEPAGVWGVVFLRCLFGAMALTPFLLFKGLPQTRSLPWGSLILVGLLNAGLPWGLIAWSETVIHSGTAAVLNATTPIWTSLVGSFVYSVPLSKRQWLGIVTGFAGILILMDFQVGGLLGDDLIGIGTMLVAAISYGFASQYARRHLSGIPVPVITTVTMLSGAMAGLLGMGVTHGISLPDLFNLKSAAALIGLGVFGSGIAHLLYYYMITEGSAEFAANVTYLIPVTAVFWGFVLLEEPLSLHLVLGMFVIFIGIYLLARQTETDKTVKQTTR